MLISFPYRLLTVVDGSKCNKLFGTIRCLQPQNVRDNHQVVTGIVGIPDVRPSDFFLLTEDNAFCDYRVELMEHDMLWSWRLHAQAAETAFYRGMPIQTNEALVAMGMFLTRNTGTMGDEFLIALDEIREASRISPLAFEAWFEQVCHERALVSRLAKAIFRIA